MKREMITRLGIVSGEILNLFTEVKGPLCVREIEVHLEEPSDVILMSLGWLIREGMMSSVNMNEENFYYPVRKDKEISRN